MNKRFTWLFRTVLASLRFRRGRSLMLLAVIAMASSLASSLGMVTLSMEQRISEEVRRYGANLLLQPVSTPVNLGSGALSFGSLAEPSLLDMAAVDRILSGVSGRVIDYSYLLRTTLLFRGSEIQVEGGRFDVVRRMMPWWQVDGHWPGSDRELLIGTDIARRYSKKPGDPFELTGSGRKSAVMTVAGIISTGGEEDTLVFTDLSFLQEFAGLVNRVSVVKILADTRSGRLPETAAWLESALPGSKAREVRQITLTSGTLLKKVQLLMVLVTVTVLAASGASVTGTMSTTVLERGGEIGLIKSMGATRFGTMLLFVAEAGLLGIIGGLAGCGIGFGIAEAVSRSVFSTPAQFSLLAIPVSLVVGLLIAVVGSMGPLLTVYRLDPVQSLRGE